MHYPLVGERVWVSGCRDEFVVVRTDYSTSIASIAAAGNVNAVRDVPFLMLFEYADFDAAQSGIAGHRSVEKLLRSTRERVDQSQGLLSQHREFMDTTRKRIQRSQEILAESEEIIRRSRTLDSAWQRMASRQR